MKWHLSTICENICVPMMFLTAALLTIMMSSLTLQLCAVNDKINNKIATFSNKRGKMIFMNLLPTSDVRSILLIFLKNQIIVVLPAKSKLVAGVLDSSWWHSSPDHGNVSLHSRPEILQSPQTQQWALGAGDQEHWGSGPRSDNSYLSTYFSSFSLAGVYECQISTTPVRSLRFNLEVVGNLNFHLQAISWYFCWIFSLLSFNDCLMVTLPWGLISINSYWKGHTLLPSAKYCSIKKNTNIYILLSSNTYINK